MTILGTRQLGTPVTRTRITIPTITIPTITIPTITIPTITLRPYQPPIVDEVIRLVETGEDGVIEGPTGSGKSLQGVTLLRRLLGKTLTHAIITTPQRQIEDGFLSGHNRLIRWPGGAVEVSKDFVRAARDGSSGCAREIIAYLSARNPDYVLSCTHAALVRVLQRYQDDLPSNLDGVGLFVDEAHHAAAEGLNAAVQLWSSRGGRLIFATATPGGRADGKDPIPSGMKRIRRSQAQHMEEGYAPRHLHNAIATFGSAEDRITAKEFNGEAVTSDLDRQKELARKMVKQWVEDGRPKTIIRIPPMEGSCKSLIKILKREFKSARVCDLTGTGPKRQKECAEILNAERSRGYNESRYDVMIGCMRVAEGTDWPVCSHVYCLGIPGSLSMVIQLIGRATRLKQNSHPSKEIAKVVFFVPGGNGDRLKDLDIRHSRHAALVCAHLADYETASQWTLVKTLRASECGLGGEAEEHLEIPAEIRAEAKIHMAAAEGTVKEMVEAASKAMPEVPLAKLQQIATELIVAERPEARDSLPAKIKRQTEIRPNVPEALEAAFAEIVDEFRDETLSSPKSVAIQIHQVTGGSMVGLATRLAGKGMLTISWIVEEMRKQLEREGSLPTQNSGEIPGTNETWKGVNIALSVGIRGLPGGSSLTQLKVEYFGQEVRGPLTIPWIVEEMKKHQKREGSLPTESSGRISGTNETWKGVDVALRRGIRGLPGGSSLAQMKVKYFGQEVKGPLTIPWIVEEMKKHQKREGSLPTENSGRISGTDETWSGISIALRRGIRGLPGGSSLAQMKVKYFGQEVKGPLTIPWIVEELRKHLEWKGKLPTNKSGSIPGTNETWKGVDAAFRQGLRGLPSGSSLAKLKQEYFTDAD